MRGLAGRLTKRAIVLAAMLLPASLAAQPAAPDFEAVLESARQGDQTVDFTWLRQRNAERRHHFPLAWTGSEEAFGLRVTAPDKALALAEKQLASDPLDIDAHLLAEMILTKAGKGAEAARHHAVVAGILRSVRGGKDGLSAPDAWNAVSVPEEYAMLFLMGLEPQRQSLMAQDGHSYDLIQVRDEETGKESAIWFNIDFFFGKEGAGGPADAR